jgi:hypothetical protein
MRNKKNTHTLCVYYKYLILSHGNYMAVMKLEWKFSKCDLCNFKIHTALLWTLIYCGCTSVINLLNIFQGDPTGWTQLACCIFNLWTSYRENLSRSSTIIWNVMPCNLVKFNDVSEEHAASIFRDEEYDNTCLLLATCLAYSSTLKMQTVCSSETSVNFYIASQKVVLQSHCCGNINALTSQFNSQVH